MMERACAHSKIIILSQFYHVNERWWIIVTTLRRHRLIILHFVVFRLEKYKIHRIALWSSCAFNNKSRHFKRLREQINIIFLSYYRLYIRSCDCALSHWINMRWGVWRAVIVDLSKINRSDLVNRLLMYHCRSLFVAFSLCCWFMRWVKRRYQL